MSEQANRSPTGTHVYDMLIIGGGPAGYTAALYAARSGLEALVLERLSAGGQMALTEQIDNYPGFDEGVLGFLLGEKMQRGAERFGVLTQRSNVLALDLFGEIKKAATAEGTFYGKTIVLATGADPRPLGIAGEEQWIGKGLSYCASCDGMFFRGKTVAVIGGGNTAAEEALMLARICRQVFLVHRGEVMHADRIYQDLFSKTSNLTVLPNQSVHALLTEEKVKGIRIREQSTGALRELACDGVFACVGRMPANALAEDKLRLDPSGYILADESTRTSVAGVFAVGDVRTKPLRQVVTAVADGAVAVYYAEEYLARLSHAF